MTAHTLSILLYDCPTFSGFEIFHENSTPTSVEFIFIKGEFTKRQISLAFGRKEHTSVHYGKKHIVAGCGVGITERMKLFAKGRRCS